MVKIIVCDDEIRTAENIKSRIIDISKTLKHNTEIYTYYNGNEILDLICNRKYQIDILLLDIDMPGINGLEVAKKIRNVCPDMILLFVSSHEQYVFKSIEYKPFRYIRKQYLSDELPHALRTAFNIIESSNDSNIVVNFEDESIRLKHSEIMYFVIENRKLALHLNNKRVITLRKTIRDFIKELCDGKFIQINSGCVVNVKYINKISSSEITLDNGEELLISRTRTKTVRALLLEYWGDKI